MIYMVMSLVGPDLDDLRYQVPKRRFTLSTTLRIGIQSLSAIEEVHSIGFLHRDIKPSNFAIGYEPSMRRNFFILDFGMARRYVELDGRERIPRKSAGFRGTVEYASLNTLYQNEMGPVDDIWSWFYMLLKFIQRRLPWYYTDHRKENRRVKESTPIDELLKHCPIEFYMLYAYFLTLTPSSTPDYEKIRSTFRSICKKRGIGENDAYDWEIEEHLEHANRRKFVETRPRSYTV